MNETSSALPAPRGSGLLIANLVLNAATLLALACTVSFGLLRVPHRPLESRVIAMEFRGPGPGGPERMGMGGMGRLEGFRPGGEPEGIGAAPTERHLERLSLLLNLTPEQKQKILPVLESQQATLRKAMEENRTQIRTLLTPEQQKTLDTLPKPPGA